MRYALSVALLALPVTALAEDGGRAERPTLGTTNQAVIGGSAAPEGKWPDTAALRFSGQQFCTGTLIAPTIVLTAGHCISDGVGDVLVGATALSRPEEGEVLRPYAIHEYPNSYTTVDAAVIVLSQPAVTPPRAIASGWARFDIQNGAHIQLVGYGTTNRFANESTDSLMEATTTITDFDCSTKAGCNTGARPDGELGAGGMGVDTCPGDSGGPLYLLTDYGSFVAGITSRGYDDNQYLCSEGGIYGRADKIVDWIEQTTGVQVSRGPAPAAPDIITVRGVGGETRIVSNDPRPDVRHTFAIKAQPAYGTAAVNGSGVVRVCPRADVVGDDVVVVSVTDQTDPNRTLDTRVVVRIADGEPDDDCDPTAFGDDGGGCCDTRRSASGSIPLALFVALRLRRRRPRRSHSR